jgi:beta-glucosidase
MTAETTTVPIGASYRDTSLPIDRRVDDLLDRMTIREKIAQLGSAWVFEILSDTIVPTGRIIELFPDGLGQVTRVAGASSYTPEIAARVANQIQRQLVEETRLGIPAIVHEEICSGMMGRGFTVFPQAIGVASTFDPELNEAIADVIREQMRHVGAHQGLSPVLDVCRDPRWGRTEETYGEDPYLVARMGNAFVAGLQGSDLSDGVVATAKHFVGYGASEGGMNWAPVHVGNRELREVFLHPFEAAVKERGLRSVMNGYHELDGVPCAANSDLMNGVLRDEWGFGGTVVSDYFSVNQLDIYHGVASGKAEAAAMGLGAGIDAELPSTDCFGDALVEALRDGLVDSAAIDAAARRTLELKFELGLFENPYVDEVVAGSAVDTDRHRALASLVAARSLVLLRNDGALPVDASVGTIAVIGPNADVARNLYGDYSYPAHVESLREMHRSSNVFDIPIPDDLDLREADVSSPSVLEALRSRFGVAVRFARGCGVDDDDRSGFAEAVELAAEADVVILVVGDKAGLTDDCTSGESRDRSSLDLPGVQEELARLVLDTGTPVVTVMVVGRPCGSVSLHERSSAVLVAWLPGQEGANAVADAIAGAVNPGGKLPMSFPRSVGQLPVFYGHKVSGGRSHWKGDYVDGPTSPLYPFGHGLSFTSFDIHDVVLETPVVGVGDTIVVSASLTNTGDVAGDEVLQVYISDPVATLTRPVIELKAFLRVTVDPMDTVTARFEIPVAQVGFYDASLQYVVEQGAIDILVGTSAADLIPAGRVVIEGGGPVNKAFDGSAWIV